MTPNSPQNPPVHIAVIGDVMLDQFTHGTVQRLSPEAPVPVVEVASREFRLGGCGNVANNAAALGATTYLVAVTGNDEAARIVARLVKEQGIIDMTIADPSRPTTTKNRIIAHKQQIARLDSEERHALSPPLQEMVMEKIAALLPKIDIIILSDYAKGFLTLELCAQIIAHAHAQGKLVIADPKAPFGKYRGADVITPNFEEFRRFGEVECDKTIPAMAPHARKLMQEHNIDRLLVTLGEQGLVLFDAHNVFHIPALRNGYEVIDITGAGDTTIATYAITLASGKDHKEAARIANDAAGVVVTKFGTAVCTPEELASVHNNQERIRA